MSDDHDHELDTMSQEADDEIRARMRALAQEVAERTDSEAAFGRVARRSGGSRDHIGLGVHAFVSCSRGIPAGCLSRLLMASRCAAN